MGIDAIKRALDAGYTLDEIAAYLKCTPGQLRRQLKPSPKIRLDIPNNTIFIKACTYCGGSLYVEQYIDGKELICLNCGRSPYPTELKRLLKERKRNNEQRQSRCTHRQAR